MFREADTVFSMNVLMFGDSQEVSSKSRPQLIELQSHSVGLVSSNVPGTTEILTGRVSGSNFRKEFVRLIGFHWPERQYPN